MNTSELIDLPDAQFSAREIIELSPTSFLVKENRHDLFIVDLVTQRSWKLNPKINPTFSTELEKKFYSMVLSRDGYLWMNQFNKVVRLNMNTEEVESFEAPVSTTLT